MQPGFRIITKAPRAYLFTRAVSSSFRAFSTSNSSLNQRLPPDNPFSAFGNGPAPPRLPKEEQEIFEALQRQSTGAFSTPRSSPQINQSPDTSADDVSKAESIITDHAEKMADQGQAASFKDEFKRVIEVKGKGEELHPNIRRGAKPEFEGDKNPETGEVGGPKNNPLRWGAAGEWSYNGRTTDF